MYQPKVVTKSSFGGPKGGAVCTWNKAHTKLKVDLGKDSYVFNADDLENIPTAFPSGEYYVQLSEDKSKLLTIRPNNGMFSGKVDRFVAKEGETPSPKTVTATDPTSKTEYSYQIFSVVLKIESPKEYKGMEVLFSPRYNFEGIEDEVEGQKVEVVAYNHPRSKYTPLLKDFCDATGVWNKGPMKWSSNILPTLAKRIAQADKKFQWVMKDGWVTTVFSSPTSNILDEDDEEDEVAKAIERAVDYSVDVDKDTVEQPFPIELKDEEDEDTLPWND